MAPFLLGLLALVAAIILFRGLSGVSSGAVLRALLAAAGALALAAAVFFTLRSAISIAVPLATLGIWLLSQVGRNRSADPIGGPDDARLSSVTTEHLEMELDLDTGEMRGRVLKGVFSGARLEDLAPAELAILWQDCRYSDPQSAQLLEAYLDRIFPTWREDMARAEQEPGAGGQMTIEEARDILGVSKNATAVEIRRAHKELILKFHPDRGGSSYLATKINAAKELLLANARSR